MTDTAQNGSGNGLDVHWGSVAVKVIGINTVVVVILTMALAAIVFDERRARTEFATKLEAAELAHAIQAKEFSEQHKEILTGFQESVREVAYILTAKQEEQTRIRARLATPEGLRAPLPELIRPRARTTREERP